jgi:hypothetical protein
MLEVMGFDRDRNTFSSLSGVRFRWEVSEMSVMGLVRLGDSHLVGDETRKQLEA